MTYSSDIPINDYYYDDEQLRKSLFEQISDMYLEPSTEELPPDLFDDIDLPYFIETKDNSWLPEITEDDFLIN